MKELIERLLKNGEEKKPVLLAVTPPRTGERTMLGVENMLQSIAVPEPFSLELAGDADGVTLMARCLDDQVVRGQIAAHYPQARIQKVDPEEAPLRLDEGEQAWGMTLRADGPEYAPLRVFRDGDLLDPGSDPLIALLGSLSNLRPQERVVARLMLSSLGPDWSQHHMERAHKPAVEQRRDPSYTYQTGPLRMDGVTMAVLGVGAVAALRAYLWVQAGETWKAALLGIGVSAALAAGGWLWHRWKKARNRVYDPQLIREKVSRIAFDGEVQVVAVLPADAGAKRAEELLGQVAAAYRHYDNPAGARFKIGKVKPIVPDPEALHPSGPGFFGGRSVLGVREAAALWHPPGARDEAPLVERSGARALIPTARGVRGGALVGETTAGAKREIHFPADLLRRHHLYVARTRMGKSTLMHHIVRHKLMEKAAGRDGDAIVVVDPHADLVEGILEHMPDELTDTVRLIDLADERGAPGVNLLDTRVFSDRDRTADSVVSVARGLWDQWGPRMQSILEQTVKTLHEANERTNADEQYTILDGLKLLSDDQSFKDAVLAKVSDPYLLDWWARDFKQVGSPVQGGGPRPGADPPLLLRILQAGQGHPGPAPIHHRHAEDHPRRRRPAGLHGPGHGGPGRGRPGGSVAAQPGGRRDTGAGRPAHREAERRAGRRGRDAVHARRGLRVACSVGAWQVRRVIRARHPEPRQAGRPLPHHARHHPGQRRAASPSSRWRAADARQLVWELGKERVTEDDITSLPVHQCYVRATVGTERMDAFSMAVSQAGDGRPGEGRAHPRRRVLLRHAGQGHRRRERGGRQER